MRKFKTLKIEIIIYQTLDQILNILPRVTHKQNDVSLALNFYILKYYKKGLLTGCHFNWLGCCNKYHFKCMSVSYSLSSLYFCIITFVASHETKGGRRHIFTLKKYDIKHKKYETIKTICRYSFTFTYIAYAANSTK